MTDLGRTRPHLFRVATCALCTGLLLIAATNAAIEIPLLAELCSANQLDVLLEAALDADPRLDDVPSGIDFAHSDKERETFELLFARAMLGRPFVAPPQVPVDRVLALRRAFDETLRDPAFLADAEAGKLRVDPPRASDYYKSFRRHIKRQR